MNRSGDATKKRQLPAAGHYSYSEGDVVWAKLKGFPWWPAVTFSSFRSASDYGIEIKAKDQGKFERGVAEGRFDFIVYFLVTTNFSFFKTDSRSLKHWTDENLQTVLDRNKDFFDKDAKNKDSKDRRAIEKAIAQADALVEQMEKERCKAYAEAYCGSPTDEICVTRPNGHGEMQGRRTEKKGTGDTDDESESEVRVEDAGGDDDTMDVAGTTGRWYEILEGLTVMKNNEKKKIKACIQSAIAAANESRVLETLKSLLVPPYMSDGGAGRAKCRALMLVEEFTGEELTSKQQKNMFLAWEKQRKAEEDERGQGVRSRETARTGGEGKRRKGEEAAPGPRLRDLTFEKLVEDGTIKPGARLITIYNVNGGKVVADLMADGKVTFAPEALTSATPALPRSTASNGGTNGAKAEANSEAGSTKTVYKGVSYNPVRRKYHAQIWNSTSTPKWNENLGRNFPTAEAAARAYNQRASELGRPLNNIEDNDSDGRDRATARDDDSGQFSSQPQLPVVSADHMAVSGHDRLNSTATVIQPAECEKTDSDATSAVSVATVVAVPVSFPVTQDGMATSCAGAGDGGSVTDGVVGGVGAMSATINLSHSDAPVGAPSQDMLAAEGGNGSVSHTSHANTDSVDDAGASTVAGADESDGAVSHAAVTATVEDSTESVPLTMSDTPVSDPLMLTMSLIEAVQEIRGIRRMSARGNPAWEWVEYDGNKLAYYETGKLVLPTHEEGAKGDDKQKGGEIEKRDAKRTGGDAKKARGGLATVGGSEKMNRSRQRKGGARDSEQSRSGRRKKDDVDNDGDEQAKPAKGRKRQRPDNSEKKKGGRQRKDGVGGDEKRGGRQRRDSVGGDGEKSRSGSRKRAAPQPHVDEEVDMSAAAAMLGAHWLKPAPGLVSAAAARPPTPPQAQNHGTNGSNGVHHAGNAPAVAALNTSAKGSDASKGSASPAGAWTGASKRAASPAVDDELPVTPYSAMTAPMLRACRCCSNTTITTPATISGAHVFSDRVMVGLNSRDGGSEGGSSSSRGNGGGGAGAHSYDAAGERALLGSYPIWDDGYYTSKSDDDHESDDDEEENSQRTSYSKQRSRRTDTRRKSSVQTTQLSESTLMGLNPHTMVVPETYAKGVITPSHTTRPSSGAMSDPATQPFSIQVHPDCHFVCDFHAHLADSEIIGLLGGYWDRDNRVLYIQAPFPCRATERDDDGATDVEMDPASELHVREIIQQHGMQVVGWYHSHPKFQPDPSVTDIFNQRSYQTLFRDELCGLDPFVGLIIGTYDTSMPTAKSIFRYFHVRSIMSADKRTNPLFMPMQLKVGVRRFRRGLSDQEREWRRDEALKSLLARHRKRQQQRRQLELVAAGLSKGLAYDSDSDDLSGSSDGEDGYGRVRRIVVSGAGGARALNRAMKLQKPQLTQMVPPAFLEVMTQADKCKLCKAGKHGAEYCRARRRHTAPKHNGEQWVAPAGFREWVEANFDPPNPDARSGLKPPPDQTGTTNPATSGSTDTEPAAIAAAAAAVKASMAVTVEMDERVVAAKAPVPVITEVDKHVSYAGGNLPTQPSNHGATAQDPLKHTEAEESVVIEMKDASDESSDLMRAMSMPVTTITNACAAAGELGSPAPHVTTISPCGGADKREPRTGAPRDDTLGSSGAENAEHAVLGGGAHADPDTQTEARGSAVVANGTSLCEAMEMDGKENGSMVNGDGEGEQVGESCKAEGRANCAADLHQFNGKGWREKASLVESRSGPRVSKSRTLNAAITSNLNSTAAPRTAEEAVRRVSQYMARFKSVVGSVIPLTRYYATYSRRADWSQVWRQEMLKKEKLQKSLAVWVPKMGLNEQEQVDFMSDLLQLVFKYWSDHKVVQSDKRPRKNGRR